MMTNGLIKSDFLVPVAPMEFPCGFDYYVDEYRWDLGYNVNLTAEECLRLIEWWNNGGKEEYIKQINF